MMPAETTGVSLTHTNYWQVNFTCPLSRHTKFRTRPNTRKLCSFSSVFKNYIMEPVFITLLMKYAIMNSHLSSRTTTMRSLPADNSFQCYLAVSSFWTAHDSRASMLKNAPFLHGTSSQPCANDGSSLLPTLVMYTFLNHPDLYTVQRGEVWMCC